MADVAPEPAPHLDQQASVDLDDGLGIASPAAPLVEPNQGWIEDDEPTAVATEAVGDVGSLSAEEAAVYVTSEDDAPGLNWDESPGYVDENPAERPSGFYPEPPAAQP